MPLSFFFQHSPNTGNTLIFLLIVMTLMVVFVLLPRYHASYRARVLVPRRLSAGTVH